MIFVLSKALLNKFSNFRNAFIVSEIIIH